MSPFAVRRYRAERLLRAEFDRMRRTVIDGVAARLRAAGVVMDRGDVEACYAQAWHGLYAATLQGEEVAEPAAWLTLVTFRRCIDEYRARKGVRYLPDEDARVDAGDGAHHGRQAQDLDAQLDDRIKLAQLFEGLRARLDVREQQAATLCYLHGLSRAEAGRLLGLSNGRMRKLMEGRGPGSPGVAKKVGALAEMIGGGRWCEEQGSLMRGFAYGILDPDGDRYRQASSHADQCPACRAYVLSLRGLAAALPPLPGLLPAAIGAGAGASATGAGAGAGATLGASGTVGAAGAGAGGGWWLAGGSLSAKLAAGCLLALGVGAGCVALREHSAAPHRAARGHRHAARAGALGATASGVASVAPERLQERLGPAPAATSASTSPRASNAGTSASAASASRARREFGPEQAAAPASSAAIGSQAESPDQATAARVASNAGLSSGGSTAAAGAHASAARASGASAAQREFAPG